MARMKAAKWQSRYLDMARLVSNWSKDPGTKVGAVVVGDHGQILSTGYNGFPRGIKDEPERLTDRETKLKFTIHAELNAVFNASLTGISLKGSTIYVYGLPCCLECAKAIIQAGISKVVIPASSIDKKKEWKESWEFSKALFAEVEIAVIEVDYA